MKYHENDAILPIWCMLCDRILMMRCHWKHLSFSSNFWAFNTFSNLFYYDDSDGDDDDDEGDEEYWVTIGNPRPHGVFQSFWLKKICKEKQEPNSNLVWVSMFLNHSVLRLHFRSLHCTYWFWSTLQSVDFTHMQVKYHMVSWKLDLGTVERLDSNM